MLVVVLAAEAGAGKGEKEALPPMLLPPRRLRRERVRGAVAWQRRRSRGGMESGGVFGERQEGGEEGLSWLGGRGEGGGGEERRGLCACRGGSLRAGRRERRMDEKAAAWFNRTRTRRRTRRRARSGGRGVGMVVLVCGLICSCSCLVRALTSFRLSLQKVIDLGCRAMGLMCVAAPAASAPGRSYRRRPLACACRPVRGVVWWCRGVRLVRARMHKDTS